MPVSMNLAVLPTAFQQLLFNITVDQNNDLEVPLRDNLRYSVSTCRKVFSANVGSHQLPEMQ